MNITTAKGDSFNFKDDSQIQANGYNITITEQGFDPSTASIIASGNCYVHLPKNVARRVLSTGRNAEFSIKSDKNEKKCLTAEFD